MRSDLQSEAARRNGAKSRGPKTPEGKANSSRNALTHGVLSKTIVIHGENPARFAALLASLRQDFDPQGTVEDSLVEDLAICRWRQRRLLAMETACLTGEIRRIESQHSQPAGPAAGPFSNQPAASGLLDLQSPDLLPATRVVQAITSLAASSQALEMMNRFELRFNRQYTRTLHRLLDMQERRRKSTERDSRKRTRQAAENKEK